ncbi:MAG: protease HtpX [Deltaproteobacteria bacterium]|nr:protease HtpX [Deltaproteobacteria bacterium]
MAKRIGLFLLTNLLVILVVTAIFQIFGIGRYTTQHGIDYPQLMIFCLVWGMAGSFISLAMSRWIAKKFMKVQLIDPDTSDPRAREMLQTVGRLAEAANIPMPEVGVYPSDEVNAFATGPSKSRSLVAVSMGMLQRMRREEVEGVLGHEIAHIANGDMVTMTLLQGVINAFVMFMARVIAFGIDQALKDRNNGRGLGFMGQFAVIMVLQTVFMALGMIVIAAFSRYREYRADAGSARLAGREKMISALEALKGTVELVETQSDRSVATMKIAGGGFKSLWATHPPLDERIERLRNFQG